MTDQEFADYITFKTGVACGVVEYPAGVNDPAFVLNTMPAFERTGSMKDPNEDEPRNYQIDIIGSTRITTEVAETRLVDALRGCYGDLPGIQGPPTIRHNGGGRTDDRRYHRIIIASFTITD